MFSWTPGVLLEVLLEPRCPPGRPPGGLLELTLALTIPKTIVQDSALDFVIIPSRWKPIPERKS